LGDHSRDDSKDRLGSDARAGRKRSSLWLLRIEVKGQGRTASKGKRQAIDQPVIDN